MMEFPLSKKQVLDVYAHMAECYPEEGVVVISGDRVIPCTNIHPEPTRAFRIDEAELIGEDQEMVQVDALIHSHPGGPRCPTKKDMEGQEIAACPWGIIATHEDGNASEIVWWGDQLTPAPYERRPFIHGVWDCYSLIRDWYRLERGIILPVFPRDDNWWMDEGVDMYVNGFPEAGFGECSRDALEYGDVVLASIMPVGYRGRAVVNHGGVYVGRGQVLHHLWSAPNGMSRRLSRVEPLGPWMRKGYVTHTLRYGHVA